MWNYYSKMSFDLWDMQALYCIVVVNLPPPSVMKIRSEKYKAE